MTEQPEPADWPSRRTDLRDQMAEALYAHDHPGWRIPLHEADVESVYVARAAAVLPVLYREWPWLRAEAEEAEPAATEATETAICPHGCNVTHCPCPACEAEPAAEQPARTAGNNPPTSNNTKEN